MCFYIDAAYIRRGLLFLWMGMCDGKEQGCSCQLESLVSGCWLVIGT